jgi:hypothetical protein
MNPDNLEMNELAKKLI